MTAVNKAFVIILALLASTALADQDSGSEAGTSRTANLAEIFENSEWVLRLHIEGIGQLVNPSMSRNHLMAIHGYRYTASVLQSWKGDHKGTIRFQMKFNDCPQILEVDREYIVFGSSTFHGQLESDACEKIIALDDARAQALLPQLDKLVAGS